MGTPVEVELQYKLGICYLTKNGRDSAEAKAKFDLVSRSKDQRWALAAKVQLWNIHVLAAAETGFWDTADDLESELLKYKLLDLVRVVPVGTRQESFDWYRWRAVPSHGHNLTGEQRVELTRRWAEASRQLTGDVEDSGYLYAHALFENNQVPKSLRYLNGIVNTVSYRLWGEWVWLIDRMAKQERR